MENSLEPYCKILSSVKAILKNLPNEWVNLTTHRLDIYNESAAKVEFLEHLEALVNAETIDESTLKNLPTAYDYIRLGHQLSSILEWVLASLNQVSAERVISFASKTMSILAILRSQKLINETTYIFHDTGKKPLIDESRLKQIYGYQYQLIEVNDAAEVAQNTDGLTVYITEHPMHEVTNYNSHIDVTVNISEELGSYMVIHQSEHKDLVDSIQHVRRRESIAMSPESCLQALHTLVGLTAETITLNEGSAVVVADCIRDNTGSESTPLIASSGLSIQYAILMGLVEDAKASHPKKPIRIILPPNCYGGTNDQSRRVAELIPNVEIVDLLVDGGANLVNSLESILNEVARIDGIPIVLAEIPTNPRVEVPDMQALGLTLSKTRQITHTKVAVKPTFMVDQTFCPNVKLLHDDSELYAVRTISFSSGSKFPSGGRCIAGYCAANQAASDLMPLISAHLRLSDNVADFNQLNILAETMPSMPQRIEQAYQNTRELVTQIQALLPKAKMFYVDDDMVEQGFKPSVFSLDLPVDAENLQQRQEMQKELNKELIKFMIEKHPNDCKNCVSYGQLTGSYWTIPATSTQGTTKEDDKDYVVRVSISPEADVTQLFATFKAFCIQNHLIHIDQ